jgi:hypothetical protein
MSIQERQELLQLIAELRARIEKLEAAQRPTLTVKKSK